MIKNKLQDFQKLLKTFQSFMKLNYLITETQQFNFIQLKNMLKSC